MFIELCFNFMSIFCVFLPSCGQLLYLCSASSSNCAILSHASLLVVSATNLGYVGYFHAWGPVLPNGYTSEKLMLNEGAECAVCLAWFYIISVYTLPP
jgi:hypothetical protein